ncbi:hypothetical protein DYBT9275_04950 [Dyadobacter sp. CECT 9275]|uniref:Uncharacterized protein n=1 Tax=Dyadobacter helix TaxID=2822344 RepID=A0A916NE20_9BACT|nr:hypothetical protein [Dyadobacter sp. CECT 9275]CAG5011438.1 hypothetical protein DYBT9275_04950 [Dyadobacter sp. CECT 9275]
MKILKLFLLFLLVSLQARATGYTHNMFVAHKKLQAGKECSIVISKDHTKKNHKPAKQVVKTVNYHEASKSLTNQLCDQVSGIATLNERILAEGPSAIFKSESEEEKEADNTIVSGLVDLVKRTIYVMVGLPVVGRP